MTEVAEVAETSTEDAKTLGRPRPTDVKERDERVFAALAAGPRTTKGLAADFGISFNLAYLSLSRLRTAGTVARVLDGEGKAVWQHTGVPLAE